MERADSGLARAAAVRWASVGRSAHPDAATAGHEAAHAALEGHDDAGVLLVFASGAYDLDVLAAAIGEIAIGVPVVGCSSAAEIAPEGPLCGSVCAVALGGEGFSFSVAAVRGADPRDAGARVAACVGDVAQREHRVLILLADGTGATHSEIVRGAYSVAGAGVPLVGGAAGHPEHRPEAERALLYGGAALRDAVVGVAIGSDAPIGIGVRHGWEAEGEPMLVTRAAAGRVLELDERPAEAAYLERLGGDAHDDTVLAHPLALRRRGGEHHVRSIWLDGAPEGGLHCAAPAGALVWVMRSTTEAVLEAAEAATADAVAALDGAAPCLVLPFDCAARLKFLGGHGSDGAREELARIAEQAQGAPVAGPYTFGEIARTRGIVGYHQQTLVVLAIA